VYKRGKLMMEVLCEFSLKALEIQLSIQTQKDRNLLCQNMKKFNWNTEDKRNASQQKLNRRYAVCTKNL